MIKCNCEAGERCTCESRVVCLKHVDFARGPKVILEDITFCIDAGIFLGIIGPNGGGKSTLLKLILGTLPLQSGHIEVFGHDLASTRADRALIGYIPQRSDIDQNFPATALDVVLMGATAKLGLLRRPSRELRERARQLLERVGVGDLADRPIGRMSGGQQQRTFIARALINQPRLLILDEPTTGLDSAGQQRFLHLLRDLQNEMQLTVIMVSHDVGQLAHYADQIACVNRKLHWHDRSAMLNDKILTEVYTCEMDAYRTRVRELVPQ
jgi:zinc transport system ATP-binding protein